MASMVLKWWMKMQGGGIASPVSAPPIENALLLEDGTNLLLEDGTNLLLE